MRAKKSIQFRQRAVFALLIAILIACWGVWGVGSALTRSTNTVVATPAAPARVVRIGSTAGVIIVGTYWSSRLGAPAILMLHGNGGNRGSMSRASAWLNAHGYAVLAIDLRGHGQSSPATKSFGLFESDDARAAIDWLRRANPGVRVGAIGYSLGGAATLLGREGSLPVDVLVLEAVYPDIRSAIFNRLAMRLGKWPAAAIEPLLSYQSYPRYGVWPSEISPVQALARVKAPVMVIGGEADLHTPPAETRALYRAVRNGGELHIVAKADHDALGGAVSNDLETALLAFLDKNLMGSGHVGRRLDQLACECRTIA